MKLAFVSDLRAAVRQHQGVRGRPLSRKHAQSRLINQGLSLAMSNESPMLASTQEEVKVWSDWCLRFEPHRELHNTQMVAAAVLATPITVVSLGGSARVILKSSWHLLVTWCDGKAQFFSAQQQDWCPGMEQVKTGEHEGRLGNRFTAMLRFFLTPQATWCNDQERGVDFS